MKLAIDGQEIGIKIIVTWGKDLLDIFIGT